MEGRDTHIRNRRKEKYRKLSEPPVICTARIMPAAVRYVSILPCGHSEFRWISIAPAAESRIRPVPRSIGAYSGRSVAEERNLPEARSRNNATRNEYPVVLMILNWLSPSVPLTPGGCFHAVPNM
jgi:hypothetical protein